MSLRMIIRILWALWGALLAALVPWARSAAGQRFYARLSRTINVDTWSGNFFGIAALLSLIRIVWAIFQTSGVFGDTPSQTVIDIEQYLLHYGLLAFAAIGVFGNAAVITLRRESETNEPISSFVTNAVGMVFFYGHRVARIPCRHYSRRPLTLCHMDRFITRWRNSRWRLCSHRARLYARLWHPIHD